MSLNNQNAKSSAGIFALSKLFDNGNFTEIGACTLRKLNSEFSGVLCAYGPICGRLTFAFAQDTEKMNGAFDSRTSKKIQNLFALAKKSAAPVIGVFCSAGSLINEGSELLSSISELFSSISDAKGKIPTIALINGVCTGSMAIAAEMFDFTVRTDDAEFSASAGFLCNGAKADSAIICENEDEAFSECRKLLYSLPDNSKSGPAIADETDMNRITGISAEDAKDMEKLLESISDGGKMQELYGSYAKEIKLGFMPVAGRYTGIVALCGKLSAKGAYKAAKFADFCADFSIPMITFANSEGIETNEKEENSGLALALSKLALAYRRNGAQKIGVIAEKAHGAILPLIASRNGACDVCFALEGALISPLSKSQAVAFLMNDKINKDTSREELEDRYAKEEASAEKAAFNGDIDFISGIDELRARICEALLMLENER